MYHHITLDGRNTSELSPSVSSPLKVANTQEDEKKLNSDGLFCFVLFCCLEYNKQAVQEKQFLKSIMCSGLGMEPKEDLSRLKKQNLLFGGYVFFCAHHYGVLSSFPDSVVVVCHYDPKSVKSQRNEQFIHYLNQGCFTSFIPGHWQGPKTFLAVTLDGGLGLLGSSDQMSETLLNILQCTGLPH